MNGPSPTHCRTCQPHASYTLITTRHITHSVRATINRLPPDWHRPRGQDDPGLISTNATSTLINAAWKRAQDRSKCRHLVETAMTCLRRDTYDDAADDVLDISQSRPGVFVQLKSIRKSQQVLNNS